MTEPRTMDEHENPTVEHEEADVGVEVLGISGGILIALVIVSMIIVFVLFNFFAGRQAALDQLPSPLSETRATPAGPQLQSNPAQDERQLRLQNQERLESYGWVDRDAGIIHIPIERAIDIVAEQGLPVRENPSNPEADGGDDAGGAP